MMKYLVALVKLLMIQFLLYGLFCCSNIDSNKLKPNLPIYQDYYVTFDKTQNKTKVEATFRETGKDGTKLVLKGDANVRFNGQSETKYTTLFHYFYTWETNGVKDVAVIYTKNSTTRFVNTFSLRSAPKVDFIDGFSTLYLDQDISMGWKGSAIEPNEKLSVTITQKGRNAYFNVSNVGATSIVINNLKNSGITRGPALINIKRRRIDRSLGQSDMGAGGEVTFDVSIDRGITIQ